MFNLVLNLNCVECFQVDVTTSHSLEDERLCQQNLPKKQGSLSNQEYPVAVQTPVKGFQKETDNSFTCEPGYC